MKVFSVCMTVVARNWAGFVIYFLVFMMLSVMMNAFYIDQFTPDFTATLPNFTVINRDEDSPLTEGLVSFLRENGNEIVIDDDMSKLQDATFFRATDYIAFIPQGFRDSFIAGNLVTLETVMTTHSAHGFITDSLLNQYFNQARINLAAGGLLSEAELVEAVLRDLALEADAEKVRFGEGAPLDMNFHMYFKLLGYIMLVMIITCVTSISMIFKRPDIRMRNICSPLKPRSLSGQQTLGSAVLSFLAWLLLVSIGFIMYGGNLGGVDGRIIVLCLLNSLVFAIVAMSIATLCGSFVHNANIQNAVANITALGMCFIGGVFIPHEMLGDGVLTVSRFLPTYWYVTALDTISALTSFEAGALTPVFQAMLMQLAFAAALFCVTLVLGKHLNQSERFYRSVRTEMEA